MEKVAKSIWTVIDDAGGSIFNDCRLGTCWYGCRRTCLDG